MQRIAKTRGVKGAASWCAFAAILYLVCQLVLESLTSFLMGLRVEGSNLNDPVGFSQTAVCAITLGIGILSLVVPVVWLLSSTRLDLEDIRIARPPQWSPLFCLIIFLGLTNLGNLIGGIVNQLLSPAGGAPSLPAGRTELILSFITLCILPAVGEELLFRGALQGLMRPCGSAAAIFGPALLFALLHLNLAQGITAFLGGIFLAWLVERTGSVLPGMLLHFINNCIAFTDMYLQQYAPGTAVTVGEFLVLLAFPVIAVWMIWRAVTQQNFSFGTGMHPGVSASKVFSSPAYLAAVVVLAGITIYQSVIPS